MKYGKNYTKGSDPLYQKSSLFVLWMLHVGSGWSWDVVGWAEDKKEGLKAPA